MSLTGSDSTHQPHPHSKASSDKPETQGQKLSLFERLLSEKGGGPDSGGPGEEEGEGYSPSPISTVSSSGEVGGVYTLYSDMVQSDEEKVTSGT